MTISEPRIFVVSDRRGCSTISFTPKVTPKSPPVVAKASHAATGKRKTVVQKVINLALHYPRAAARVAGSEQLAALNQPGSDVLRRVLDTAATLGDASAALLLENLRDDPDFEHLERIGAEPPLGIDDEDAALSELKASLENLRQDAVEAANVERIRAGRPLEPRRDP